MNHSAPETLAQTNTEILQKAYADMIWSVADSGGAWERMDAAWQELPEVEVVQGAIRGRLRRENVSFNLGSLTGYSVYVGLETEDGPHELLLGLNGREPRFSIQVAEQEKDDFTITPVREDYAYQGIQDGFDWEDIIARAKQHHELDTDNPLYLVVFRSQLKAGVDTALLLHHDHQAHEAAKQSPALLYYFGGEPDEEGRALSFCLWSDQEEAKELSKDARHMAARKMVSMYESYSLEKYSLFIGGAVTFVPHA
jgi:hypothetical protein